VSRQSVSIARIRRDRRSKGQCAGCGVRSKAYRCQDCAPKRKLLSKKLISSIRRLAAFQAWAKKRKHYSFDTV
jgi:hypothetical protein